MKKVFLTLAMIATLSVVSCKQAETAPAEEVTTEEVTPMAEENTMVADSAAAVATDAAATAQDAAATAQDAAADAKK